MMTLYTAAGTAMVGLFSRLGVSASVMASVPLWMPTSIPIATACFCGMRARRGSR